MDPRDRPIDPASESLATSAGDATSAADDAYEPPGDDASLREALGRAPLLSIVSALAALADLGISRVLVPTTAGRWPNDAVLALLAAGAWPRNLAAITGLVALVLALVSYLRLRGYASIVRRLLVASFAGIFVPTVLLAIVMPRERTNENVVVFATAAADVLATLLASTAARARARTVLRVGAGLLGVATFAALTWLTASRVVGVADSPLGQIAAAFAALVSEGAHVLALLVLTLASLPSLSGRRSVAAIVLGAFAMLGSLTIFLLTAALLRSDFGTVLYSAQRFELLIEVAPIAYAVPLSVAIGGGVAGLVSGAPMNRQLGASLLLLVAAGCTPRSPGRLLSMLLAVALAARVAVASADARRAPRRPQPSPSDG